MLGLAALLESYSIPLEYPMRDIVKKDYGAAEHAREFEDGDFVAGGGHPG